MKKLFVLLALLGTTLMAADKTVYDFTLNSIDGQATPLLTVQGESGAAGERGQPLRIYAAILRARSAIRKIQGSRLRDRGSSCQQFWRAGAGLEPGDQDVLHVRNIM